MLLPYCVESFPLRIRGRATGVVAACSKLGGVFAQALAIMAIIPTLAVSAMMIAVPMLLSRSEEHTSELQSLMRNSYADFCLKKKRQVASAIHRIPDRAHISQQTIRD